MEAGDVVYPRGVEVAGAALGLESHSRGDGLDQGGLSGPVFPGEHGDRGGKVQGVPGEVAHGGQPGHVALLDAGEGDVDAGGAEKSHGAQVTARAHG